MGKKDRLFEIADRQQGYFTVGQAVECGYSRPNFQYHVVSGEWVMKKYNESKLLLHISNLSKPQPYMECFVQNRKIL